MGKQVVSSGNGRPEGHRASAVASGSGVDGTTIWDSSSEGAPPLQLCPVGARSRDAGAESDSQLETTATTAAAQLGAAVARKAEKRCTNCMFWAPWYGECVSPSHR